VQQRGLNKQKEILLPYPEHSFGTEDVPQETYLQWVSSKGMKYQAYVAFVKAKLDWLSHWGHLDEMNALMPEFNAKLKAHVAADYMVKEWTLKNTLKPTSEQAALMAQWGMALPAPLPAGKRQQFLNAYYKEWAIAQKSLEANGYGPFEELPPTPYLSLLGLVNVATVPKNTSPQGIADDVAVLRFLQKYPDIWLGIPVNANGVLVNI
jgi:hypothetical protein